MQSENHYCNTTKPPPSNSYLRINFDFLLFPIIQLPIFRHLYYRSNHILLRTSFRLVWWYCIINEGLCQLQNRKIHTKIFRVHFSTAIVSCKSYLQKEKPPSKAWRLGADNVTWTHTVLLPLEPEPNKEEKKWRKSPIIFIDYRGYLC